MPADLAKTLIYLAIHLAIGFGAAYVLTGSAAIAGGIALIEPCLNAVAFFFHEKAWKKGRLAFGRPWPRGYPSLSVRRGRRAILCNRIASREMN